MANQGYNENLDKILADKNVPIDDKRGFDITIHSYDNNQPKIQISKYFINNSGQKQYVKTGRFSFNEFTQIAKGIKSLMAQFNNNGQPQPQQRTEQPQQQQPTSQSELPIQNNFESPIDDTEDVPF